MSDDPQTRAFNVMMEHVRRCSICSQNSLMKDKWCPLGKGFWREYAKAGRKKS